MIDALTAAGAFKGGKVGLVTLAADEGLLKEVVLPSLKRNKVTGTTSAIDRRGRAVTWRRSITR